MMTTTDLKLQETGALPKPGPLGRLVRLIFGIATLSYVFMLWEIRGDMMLENDGIRPLVWNGILPGVFLISYIVNIGFSRAWKKWPAILSVLVMLSIAGLGFLQTGSFETPMLGRALHSWELYLFTHLGLAFVLSGLIGTPGCEMRAFHHLYSLITRKPTMEHHCPVGPLQPLDRWEASQNWMKRG